MIVCTCDHCGKELRPERPGYELAERPYIGHPPEPWGDPWRDVQFCDLLCLTGWAMAQSHKFGFHNRIPKAKQ